MKKRFIISYAVFSAIFILFSLSFLGYNLIKEYKEGESRSRTIFANTIFNLYGDLSDEYDSTTEFYQNISAAAGSLQNYSFYEIIKNNKIIYSYPGDVSNEATTSKLTKSFSTTIELEEDNYLITCNIYLLRPYSIYYYSRITFLLILGITLLTIILILFTKNKSNSEIVEIDNNEKDDIYYDDTSNLEDDNKTDDIDDFVTNNNETISDTYGESPFSNENIDLTAESENNQSEPEGLFSDLTGFGWESYLITRLNNELNRAIASELDISLFIIKLSNLERTNDLTKQICDYIVNQFPFRDLLFEYKEQCLVIIKTGDNLEDSLNFADKLYKDISDILNNTNSKCYIGITTRSVRMISADRFINEAEQALTHAEESEDNPIIAFKADIDKYRKYVEQNFNN